MADPVSAADPLAKGMEFLRQQDAIFMRNAWIYRVVGWICGWGAVVVATLGAADKNLLGPNHDAAVWGGFLAAALAGIDKTVKCDMWAEAYYRGHLILEQVVGDELFGKVTADDLSDAWHIAQSGMPGANPSTPKKPLPK